jgi:uncharacterized membrane protein
VIVGLLASVLISGLGGMSGADTTGQNLGLQQMESVNQLMWMLGSVSLVLGILSLVLGGAVEMGYARFNLALVDGQPVRIGMLFGCLDRIWAGIRMVLWRSLMLMVWAIPSVVIITVAALVAAPHIPQETLDAMAQDPMAVLGLGLQFLPLVLISMIPVVVAGYRYMLMPYLMAEHPEIGAREAMRLSKQMMHGVKGNAFGLRLSFLGWEFLCIFTFGIGFLWLQPYIAAADAAFYRELSSYRRVEAPRIENPSPEF